MEHKDKEIALVTDSSCDLPKEFIMANDIIVLPMHIVYKDRDLRDGIDITSSDIMENIDKEIPTTSMPSPFEVNEALSEIKSRGQKKAVFITLSSELSGAYDVVKMMCDMQNEIEVEVIDSKYLSMGLGYLVEETVKLIGEGTDIGEFTSKLNEKREMISSFFFIPSLDYLIKGGRVGVVLGALGKILQLKPVMSISKEGKFQIVSKVLGHANALKKMKSILVEKTKGYSFDVTLLYSKAQKECMRFLEEISSLPGIVSSKIAPLGSIFAVHGGPGVIAAVIRLKK